MGREIYTQIVKLNKEKNIWEDIYEPEYAVCGRDECTNFVTNYIYNHADNQEENWYYDFRVTSDNKSFDDKELENFREELLHYSIKDQKQLDKVSDYIYDLREARRNANTLKAFKEFSVEIEDAEEYIAYYNSTGKGIYEQINDTIKRFWELKEINPEEEYRVRIIVSE